MQTSYLLAQILGLYLTLVSGAMLLQGKKYQRFLIEAAAHKTFVSLTGLIALIIGIIIVILHNFWQWRWPLLISLLGLTSLVKGIIHLYSPYLAAHNLRLISKPQVFYPISIFSLLLGCILLFLGFQIVG